MSWEVMIVIAVMTYGSRALALVLLPNPSARVRAVLDRIPAPLFASIAALSLIEDGALAPAETLFAAAGALLLTPTRSMLWVLAGGLAGYGAGSLLFS
jgi:branched-subunit amino acid transport protein